MLFQAKIKTELKAADAVLAKRTRTIEVIASEVRKLSEVAKQLLAAERDFRDAQVERMIGGSDAEDVDSRAETLRSEIQKIGGRLQALRSSLKRQAPELLACHNAIAAELPSHESTIEQDFSKEWSKAVTAFSAVQARRAVIERELGRKLVLADPVPSAIDTETMAEMFRPLGTVRTILGILEALNGRVPSDLGSTMRRFDHRAVHVMGGNGFKDSTGPFMPPGTVVVESSFEAGWLEFLVGVGDSFIALDPREAEATNCARLAGLQVKAAESERRTRIDHGLTASTLDAR